MARSRAENLDVSRAPVCLLLGVLLAAAGCGKGKKGAGDTCDAVGANFLTLSHRQLDDARTAKQVDDQTYASVSGHLPAIRDAMVRACKDNAWTVETRACFARATDDAAIKACYQAMPAEQRELLEKASAGESSK
jgi:hypothetical protein